MLAAVLTCDFLVSPAFASEEVLETCIEDLVDVNSALERRDHVVAIEDDAMGKLVLSGQYPAENLFKSHLQRAGVRTYSAHDVARTVNQILARATEVSKLEPELELEISLKKYDPAFAGIEDTRRESLEELMTQLAARKEASNIRPHVLHRCKINDFDAVTVELIVSYMVPEEGRAFPWAFSTPLGFSRSYEDFLNSVDCNELYARATDAGTYKVAVYLAARQRMIAAGRNATSFTLRSFALSTGFFPSILHHQCNAGGRYGAVTFDSIVDLVAGTPKNEPKAFWSNESGGDPRKHGEFSAYRVHITKCHVGMRLLYWQNGIGQLVLANVGPKGELVIENP